MTTETIKLRKEYRRKKKLREITTHIVLLLLVFGYTILGAQLFQSIEEKYEQRAKGNLIKSKHDFLDRTKLGVGSPWLDQKNWTRMVDRLLNYYVEDLAVATSHGVDITDVTQHEYESDSKWDFWGSLFYAGTVYTTIGYGNFAPVTPEGKVATIIYGMIGIPLCLILLADLGNLIAKLIKYSVKKLKKQFYPKSKKNLRELWPPQDEIDSMSGMSSFVVLCIVSVLYFVFGALMYKSWEEDWGYLDAVYFIFVSTRNFLTNRLCSRAQPQMLFIQIVLLVFTLQCLWYSVSYFLFLYLSTIGFGDVLPSEPKKFIFTSLYIFFGLSLLSSGFTIIQELLENRITQAKTDLDAALGIKKIELESLKSPKTPGADAVGHEMTTSSTSDRDPVETIPGSAVIEKCIVQKSVNNTLASEPIQKFQVPIETNTSSSASQVHSTASNFAEDCRVSETRVISLDDGILSVEATIILD